MSKIFNRPMFRKGGEVGGGIMTGVMRDNFDVGGSATEQLMKVAQQYPDQGMDPFTQFLIEGGINLASQPSTGGGIIADIATAAKGPTSQLMTGLSKRGNFNRDLALAGAKIDIEQKGALDVARAKAAAESGLQKDYSPQRRYYELYSKYTDPNKKGFTTTIEQDYPTAMADYGSYIEESVRARGDNIAGVIPYKKSGKTYDWNFDEMIPGAKYFKPDTKRLYERDPDKNILIEYDPYTGKKLKEYSLGG
jgi:hypothetical protein